MISAGFGRLPLPAREARALPGRGLNACFGVGCVGVRGCVLVSVGSVVGLPVVIVVDIVIESSVPVSLWVSTNRSPSSFSRSLV